MPNNVWHIDKQVQSYSKYPLNSFYNVVKKTTDGRVAVLLCLTTLGLSV